MAWRYTGGLMPRLIEIKLWCPLPDSNRHSPRGNGF